jgi:hypothetical protein
LTGLSRPRDWETPRNALQNGLESDGQVLFLGLLWNLYRDLLCVPFYVSQYRSIILPLGFSVRLQRQVLHQQPHPALRAISFGAPYFAGICSNTAIYWRTLETRNAGAFE